MTQKIKLDKYEKDIESKIDNLASVPNVKKEMASIRKAATNHLRKNKSITLRVNNADLEVIRLKASKLGVKYQTYLNILIHKEATSSGLL